MADLRNLVFNVAFNGNTNAVTNMNSQVNKLKSNFSGVSSGASSASSAIQDAGGKASAFGGAVKTLGTAIAGAFAVSKIVDFGKAAISAAGEAQAMNSQFTQTFGELEPAAQSAVDSLATQFGMVPNRVKPAMSQMTSMFKGLGLDTESAMAKASDAVTITADAAAFYDKSFEDANSALTSFVKGSYEGGESIGLFANDTQMANYAIEQGLVSSTAAWSSLDEATKQATRLEYAQNMQELAGATGQAAREQDGLENQLGNIKQAWEDFLAIVGGPILGVAVDALKGATSILQELGDGFKTLTDKASNLDLSGVQAEFAPFGEAFSGIKDSAMTAFDGIKTTFIDNLPKIQEAGQPIFDAFYGMWENIKPVFLYLAETISNVVIPAFQTMYQKYIELLPSIISFVTPIYEVIAGIGSIIGNVVGLVAAVLQGDWSQAWQFGGNIVEGIGNIVNGTFSFIGNIITGAVDGIKNAFSGISDFIVSAFDGAVTFISSLPGKFLQWGSDMISGLIQGVKDKVTSAIDAVESVATGISSAFTSFFDINSPSRLFRGYGRALPEGAALGVLDGVGVVKTAVSKLSSALSAEFTLSDQSASSNQSSTISTLGEINEPVLLNSKSSSSKSSSNSGSVVFAPTFKTEITFNGDGDISSNVKAAAGEFAKKWENEMNEYLEKLMLRNPQLAK